MKHNLSNLLSFIRIPLAFVFLSTNPIYRALAIILAIVTDVSDGYFARKYENVSRFGAVLDPLADKFFVLFGVYLFIQEKQLTIEQALTFLSRDIAVVLYGCYLWMKGLWKNYRIRSIWSGKLMTSLQFVVLLCLTFRLPVSQSVYPLFVIIGLCAFLELLVRNSKQSTHLR